MPKHRSRVLQTIATAFLVLLVGASPANAQEIAAGWDHTVMARPDGTVWTWGSNFNGQLGDLTQMSHPTPWQVPGLSGIVAVAAGAGHTMALSSGGTVWVWGLNSSGQLGDGTLIMRREPVQLGLTGVVAIAAGLYHSVALKSDGTVYTWGFNQTGQLGNNSTANSNSPVQVAVSAATGIAAGSSYTLIVASDATVWGWGANGSGQLGDGTTTQRLVPTQMSGVTNAAAVDGSNGSSFVRLADGTVRSVGYNGTGTLGDGTQTHRTTTVAVTVLTDVIEVAAGDTHVLALKMDGTVWAWGHNGHGQLGLNDQTYRSTPTQIPGLVAVASVGAGDNQSFAITADTAPSGSNGVLWAWGYNSNRELGDGSDVMRLVPVAVTGPNFIAKVATPTFSQLPGTYTSPINVVVSTVTSGAQIHYTTTGSEPTPSDAMVSNGGTLVIDQNTTLKALAISVGMPDSNFAAATYVFSVAMPTLNPAGGSFTSPPTVSMSTTTPSSTIRYTTDGSTPTGSSPAYSGALTISTTSTVKAIATRPGWTSSGVRTGTFTLQYGTTQMPAANPSDGTYDGHAVVSLSAAAGATIRYTTTGGEPSAGSTVYAGPLTFAVTTTLKAKAYHPDYNASATLTQVYTIRALAPTLNLSSGGHAPGTTVTISHPDAAATIRMTITGTDPTASDVAVPSGTTIAVGGFTLKARASKSGCLDSVVSTATYSLTEAFGEGSVTAGSTFTLVARPDGVLYAFGQNASSQLGDGTATNRTAPVLVQTLTGVTQVTAGASHALARAWDGRLYAWGSNGSGRLGDGTTTSRTRPVLLGGIADVMSVSAGGSHTLALTGAGHVYAWGAGSAGQLGLGDTASRSLPTLLPTLTDVVAIAAGANHSLALTSAGQVYAWGSNGSSQLGDGTTATRLTPTLLSSLSGVVGVVAGSYHSMAHTGAGAAYVWGTGSSGQLGLGTTTPRTTPTLLSGLSVINLVAGSSHSGAIRNDGQLVTSGANSFGQLGDATTTQRLVPTMVANLAPSALVASGDNHMVAITSTGHVWTWGLGTSGQLGDGTINNRSTPQAVFTLPGTWGATPAPTLSPTAGIYATPQTLVVSHSMPGAAVRYTSDNSEPTEASAELPAGGTFPIEGTQALRFRAWASTLPPSRIVNATYTLQAVQPTISPAPGTYASGQTVTLSTATTGTTLRYTLDGSEPTESSSTYAAPVALATTSVVKVKAFRTNWTPSLTASAALTFNYGTLDSPVVSPGNGTYAPTQEIVLTAAAGATIVYTLDGSDPSGSSLVYNTPLTLPIGSTTLKARAYLVDWTPSAVVTRTYQISTDTTPPTITAQVSPEANQHGWHNGDVTVTFTCEDAESGIASCPGPVTVTYEGPEIKVHREAVNGAGGRGGVAVMLKVDLTDPRFVPHYPLSDDVLPLGTGAVAVRGAIVDVHSGLASVTCDASAGVILGHSFSCPELPVTTGTTTIVVQATDFAGNESAFNVPVTVGPSPNPTQLQITPSAMTMVAGEAREVRLNDQRSLKVTGGTLVSNNEPVADVANIDGVWIVQALAAGTVTLTASRDGLTAEATVTVLAAGSSIPSETPFWELPGNATEVPKRTTVVRAVTGPENGARQPDLYYLEGKEWTAGPLRQFRIRAVTLDGQQLWDRFLDENVKHISADNYGGIVLVLENTYSQSSSLPERVQRRNGASGHVSWEYYAADGTLSEAAVHPDGTVFVTDETYYTADTFIVALNGDTGAPTRTSIPRGHFVRYVDGVKNVDADDWPSVSGPIVLRDGTVVAMASRSVGEAHMIQGTNGLEADPGDPGWTRHDTYQLTTVPGGGVTVTALEHDADGAGFNFRDTKVMPDGDGGLLVVGTASDFVGRVDSATGLGSTAFLLPNGLLSFIRESEYVLGDAGGYALFKGHTGSAEAAYLVGFDTATLALTEGPWPVLGAPDVYLRFAAAGGGVHTSGPTIGGVFANDTQVDSKFWTGWSPRIALFGGHVPESRNDWSRPSGNDEGANQASGKVTVTVNAFIPEEWAEIPVIPNQGIHNGNNRGFGRVPPPGSSFEVRDGWSKAGLEFTVDSSGSIGSKRVTVGPTREYDKASSVGPDGKLTWAAKTDMVPDDDYLMTYVGRGRTDGIQVSASRQSNGTVFMTIIGSFTNPNYDNIIERPFATIDYRFSISLDFSNPSAIGYTISGEHDGFPNYEVYVNEQRIVEYEHGAQTPISLGPPMEWSVQPASGSVPR